MGIISVLRSGDIISALIYLLSTVFVVFVMLPGHEFAHAFAAHKLGDDTAKWQGRMTLNPFAHIDWIGAALILVVGFGWAKPVPVNSYNLRRPKSDMAVISFAGPLANLIMGFAAAFFYNACKALMGVLPLAAAQIFYYLAFFFLYAALISIGLAIFNLIPAPPLDGSKILAAFLPNRLYYKFMQYERYLYFLVLILMVTGALSVPLSYVREWVFNFFDWITALPFGGLLR